MNNLHENLPAGDFDRELTLKELLSATNGAKLCQIIASLIHCKFSIKSNDEQVLLGETFSQPGYQTPLYLEIEQIGQFVSEQEICNEMITTIKLLIESLLTSSSRYLMASSLHFEATQSDYEELKKINKALVQSESRYKKLAKNLEQRVAQQVETIDKAHRQLYQAEKLASVGQLAAGIAHEINNPMNYILTNTTILEDYSLSFLQFFKFLKSASDINEVRLKWTQLDMDHICQDIQDISKDNIVGVQRVTRIIKDLKNFSNIDHAHQEIVDINTCIISAANMLKQEESKREKLTLNLNKLPPVHCQPGQMNQALFNILLNAEQATKEDGIITVSSECKDNIIYLHFVDNGLGIPEAMLTRVFEPFYTTKDVGEGTGLGLTVSRGIVLNYGGDIFIESQGKGKGTKVTITLPATE